MIALCVAALLYLPYETFLKGPDAVSRAVRPQHGVMMPMAAGAARRVGDGAYGVGRVAGRVAQDMGNYVLRPR